ncbi:MAG: hypothetical protein IJU50_08595 [Lachnospiraceae bacterium]|nr:hypothetical protein [Lachnospiraceae bacterium]
MRIAKSFACFTLALSVAACALTGCGGGQDAQTSGAGQEQKAEAAASAKGTGTGGDSAGKYVIYRYGEGETSMDGELLKASGMDKSFLELNADHTGTFVLADAEMPIEWNDSGEISVSGAKLYSFKRAKAKRLSKRAL